MKKFNLVIVLIVVLLFAVFFINAINQEKNTPQKSEVTIQKHECTGHEEGTAECQEKHAAGECDHDPGKPHSEENCDYENCKCGGNKTDTAKKTDK